MYRVTQQVLRMSLGECRVL